MRDYFTYYRTFLAVEFDAVYKISLLLNPQICEK